MRTSLFLLIAVIHFHSVSFESIAEDWPRWRGPRGDGTWKAPKLPDKWPESGLKQAWRQPVGGGYAGVTVADGRVYIADRPKDKSTERILCFDAKTGIPLWNYSYNVEYGDLQYASGPRAAVTVVDGKVYSLGAVGDFFCLDAVTGRKIWDADLMKDFNGRMPTWGYAASPFVDDDLVITMPGGSGGNSIVAFDRHGGKVAWKGLDDEAAYATPILFTSGDRRQLAIWTPSHVRAIAPQTGKLLWSVPYKVTMGVSIATPIFAHETVVVCGYWEGSKAVRLGKNPADSKLLWEENRYLRGLMSQPLVRGDHAFLLDKQYGLTCFELSTGKKLWDDKNQMTPRGRNPHASLVWLSDEDRAIILNSNGDLILARINKSGYHEQSRTKIIGETWAHPAYVGNRVYARSDTELVCVELPTKSK